MSHSTYLCALSCLEPQNHWRTRRELIWPGDIPKLADDIANEIIQGDHYVTRKDIDVKRIVLEAIEQLNNIETVYGVENFYWPYYERAIAIGFFDDQWLAERRLTGGKGAERRLVIDFNAHGGWWDSILVPSEEHSSSPRLPEGGLRIEARTTETSPSRDNPNFWILEGPCRYLEAWFDHMAVPQRYERFPYDEWEMSLHEELWDIVNSFEGDEGRCMISISRVLPSPVHRTDHTYSNDLWTDGIYPIRSDQEDVEAWR